MIQPITVTLTDESGKTIDSFTIAKLPFGADERDHTNVDYMVNHPLAVCVITGSMVLDRLDQALSGRRESFRQWFGRMKETA